NCTCRVPAGSSSNPNAYRAARIVRKQPVRPFSEPVQVRIARPDSAQRIAGFQEQTVRNMRVTPPPVYLSELKYGTPSSCNRNAGLNKQGNPGKEGEPPKTSKM